MNALETTLQSLPEPAPPKGLSQAVMTRIAQLDEEHRRVAAGQPARPATRRLREVWAAAAIVLGVAVGFAAPAYQLLVGQTALDLTSPRIGGGIQGVVQMMPANPAAAVLAVGLLLYLSGLFAPLRDAA